MILSSKKTLRHCETSSDCDASKNELCIESRCVSVEEMQCNDDVDCVSGMICGEDSKCVAKFPCHSDKDCYRGERCYPISGCGLVLEGSPCESTSDCGLNMICVLKQCRSSRSGDDDVTSRPCNDVNQCVPPSLCDMITKTCMTPRTISGEEEEGEKREDNTKSNSLTCSSITDCAEHYVCMNEKCVYAGTNTPCKGTPDCAQGFKCVNKFCQIVKLFKSCKSSVLDCGNMQTCSRKTCISSPNQSKCLRLICQLSLYLMEYHSNRRVVRVIFKRENVTSNHFPNFTVKRGNDQLYHSFIPQVPCFEHLRTVSKY